MTTTNSQQLTIVEHGTAGAAAVAHARERIVHAFAHVSEPIGPVYLTVDAPTQHRHGREATVSVHVDVAGDVVCARATAATVGAAVEELHDRLRTQLDRRAEQRADRRRNRPSSDR